MISLRICLWFACGVLFSACFRKTSPGEQPPSPPIPEPPVLEQSLTPPFGQDGKNLIATMEETGCIGRCPVYQVEVWSDGSVHWHGKRYSGRDGDYEARAPITWLAELFHAADKVGYRNFASYYLPGGTEIADFPRTMTALKQGNEFKKVVDAGDAPREVLRFERFFRNHLEKLNWEKKNP